MEAHIPDTLQLASLLANNPNERSPITQNLFPALNASNEANLLESVGISTTHAPHVSDELVAGLDGAGEAGLELLEVCGVGAAEQVQNAVGGAVPAEQAVHDGAAEAHLHARLRVRVQRVVVAVQPVQQRGLGRRLQRVCRVGSAALWRWIQRVLWSCWESRSVIVVFVCHGSRMAASW